MDKRELTQRYAEFGKIWAANAYSNDANKEIEQVKFGDGEEYTLNEKQIEFLNAPEKYVLFAGGLGAGKTLPLLMKMVFSCLCFPKNRVLLGRKTLADVKKSLVPELFDLVPENWYEHRIKDGIVKFFNGSEILLYGLDALQGGSQGDIKKAEQKIQSLNLGGIFIDQLEEIEERVFEKLTGRIRRKNTPRQISMTTNPANFWAYNYFVKEPKKFTKLIQTSMLDNEENLPDDYIETQLDKGENWVRRFVYGEWNTDLLTPNAVFDINQMKLTRKDPKKEVNGCKIYKKYDNNLNYQMGIDPSEGSIDPASITIVSEKGEEVAKFNDYIPIPGLISKIRFLNKKYGAPLIIPEVNNTCGGAVLNEIKDLDVYKRKVYDREQNKRTKKLGFHTNSKTKGLLIGNFQDLLDQKQIILHDKETIEEFKTFEWTDSAKKLGAGASPGNHDDNVMSTLLAFWEFKPQEQKAKRIKRSIPHMKKRKFQYI